MPIEWATAQLTSLSLVCPLAQVQRDFHRRLPLSQFLFPATRDGMIFEAHPLAEYCFVSIEASDGELLRQLSRSPFVDHLLVVPGTYTLQRLSTREVRRLTRIPLVPAVGQQVEILAGDWEGLTGQVVEVYADSAKVYVQLHSRDSVVTLRLADLSKV